MLNDNIYGEKVSYVINTRYRTLVMMKTTATHSKETTQIRTKDTMEMTKTESQEPHTVAMNSTSDSGTSYRVLLLLPLFEF